MVDVRHPGREHSRSDDAAFVKCLVLHILQAKEILAMMQNPECGF